MYKVIGKYQIKTPKRDLGSSLRFLNVQERWEWIILGIILRLNSSAKHQLNIFDHLSTLIRNHQVLH